MDINSMAQQNQPKARVPALEKQKTTTRVDGCKNDL